MSVTLAVVLAVVVLGFLALGLWLWRMVNPRKNDYRQMPPTDVGGRR